MTTGKVQSQEIASGAVIASLGYTPAKISFASVAPSSPKAGDWWFDTSVNRMKYYDGTSWLDPLKYQ